MRPVSDMTRSGWVIEMPAAIREPGTPLRNRLRGAGDVSRLFLFHFRGVLVVTQPLKRGMTDSPVFLPSGKSDFAKKRRPHPEHRLPLSRAHALRLHPRQHGLGYGQFP